MIAAVRLYDPAQDDQRRLTLREFYEETILPVIQLEQSQRSLVEDRVALNHWERLTGNPDLKSISRKHIARFRDGLIEGRSAATVNKCWREIKSMLRWASEEDVLERVPVISHRSKSRLCKEAPKKQRETLSMDEITALYRACRAATYPAGGRVPAPKLWRCAIVLWYFYGARTLDVVRELTWDNIHWQDRLIVYRAMKTRKLQGVPLTDLVVKHLRSVQRSSPQIFAGFRTPGHHNARTGKWKRGYYTTWRNEIQPAAELSGIWIKHFREAMITRNNGIEPGLGNWIAGHYMPGVSAQNYDLPTKRIREAVESTPVPECFYELD